MTAPERPRCERCLRPQSTCLCAWVTPTPSPCQVLILQHPLEVAQAKGSARLLHLSLPNSRLLIGETFDPLTLQALLDSGQRPSVLLYPGDPAACTDTLPTMSEEGLQLVVLDGTWRKSRKMLHLNPILRHLPRLSLAAPPPSRYRIRKAHRPGQLSTLEATCLALQQLEGDPDRWAPLLSAFDAFVEGHSR